VEWEQLLVSLTRSPSKKEKLAWWWSPAGDSYPWSRAHVMLRQTSEDEVQLRQINGKWETEKGEEMGRKPTECTTMKRGWGYDWNRCTRTGDGPLLTARMPEPPSVLWQSGNHSTVVLERKDLTSGKF
jgi:hypothetical protein